MKMKLIAPFSAMLFGLSACTYVEDGPYVSYQAQFAIGGPLYYSGGPVTWRYYDGYTYHLFDHHGRFVGYAYYDYDHFYRIADVYGAIVYFLRWSNGGWLIHDHRNRHLGYIQVDNHGNHWIADTQGRRHGAMHGWARSGSHGHSHAGRHDNRVEHRESRHRYDAERDRWRNKKHDAEIRNRQEHATHNLGNEDSRRRNKARDGQDDRRRGRRDDRERNGQRDHGVNMTPVPGASQGTLVAPRKANQPQRKRGNVAVQPTPNAQGSQKAKKNSRGNRGVVEPRRTRRGPAASPTVRPSAKSPAATPRAAPVVTPRAAPVVTPRAAPVVTPRAAPVVTPKAKQAAPKSSGKPQDKGKGKGKGKKSKEEVEKDDSKSKSKRGEKDRNRQRR